METTTTPHGFFFLSPQNNRHVELGLVFEDFFFFILTMSLPSWVNSEAIWAFLRLFLLNSPTSAVLIQQKQEKQIRQGRQMSDHHESPLLGLGGGGFRRSSISSEHSSYWKRASCSSDVCPESRYFFSERLNSFKSSCNSAILRIVSLSSSRVCCFTPFSPDWIL